MSSTQPSSLAFVPVTGANALALRELVSVLDVCVEQLSSDRLDSADDDDAAIVVGLRNAAQQQGLISHLIEDVTARHVELENIARRLSQCATRLTLLLKPPATTDDLTPLLDDFRACAVVISQIVRVVPRHEGVGYRGELYAASVSLLASTAELANTFLDVPQPLSNVPAYLFNTGMVWKAAETFAKLPRNSRDAALQVWNNRQIMLEDAIGELDQLLSATADTVLAEDGDFDDDEFDDDDGEQDGTGRRQPVTLSDDERVVAKIGLALVRSVRLVGKKMSMRLIEPLKAPIPQPVVAWLDEVVKAIEESTGTVDELTVALYPPHDKSAVETHAKDAVACARKLLSLATTSPLPQALSEADLQWFEKMRAVVSEALDKFVPTLPAR